MKKIFVSGVIFALFILTNSSIVTAAVNDEILIKKQINELVKVVALLQKQVLTMSNSQKATPPKAFTYDLRLGSEGEEVVRLQEFLAQDKKIYPEGIISGYFGNMTLGAVKRFQEKHSLALTGEVGPQTRSVLSELLSTKLPEAAIARIPSKLFAEADDDLVGKTLPENTFSKQSRVVSIDFNAITAEEIEIQLSDTLKVVAVKDSVVLERNNFTWIGHVKDFSNSEVILTKRGSVLAGTVQYEDRLFEIVYSGNSLHRVTEIDLKKVNELELKTDTDIVLPESDVFSDEVVTNASDVSGAFGNIIDVMIVYTPKAKTAAGGVDGIESRITNAVAQANTAYINSGIDMQINLVHMSEVNYSETGSVGTTLQHITGKSDGQIDDIHALRDQYGADQVSIITEDTNSCGTGYLMSSVSRSFSQYAFSVVRTSCLSQFTLAHELGHNQGSHHNIEDSSSSPAYPYSYGYRVCQTGGFRTVMSYACSGGTRVGHFSNPDIYYGGYVTGADMANNALSLNNTAPVVASFLVGSVTSVPAAPTNVMLQNISATEIAVTWSDNSSNEDGYLLERSFDGASWSSRASLPENSNSYSDTGLNPDTTYYYRVQAYNSLGGSEYSNVASIHTNNISADTEPPTLSIVDPIEGSVMPSRGSLVLSVSAEDNVGVSSIQIFFDDSLVTTCSNVSVCSGSLNVRKISDGIHYVVAKAYDASNNSAETSISIVKGGTSSGGGETTGPTKGKKNN